MLYPPFCFLPPLYPSYQGEEQEVHLYYKEFSSTRHGFLGAGVVSQPLSHVWAAVSDPTLWPLYHKPIQTARLHQQVTNSISLGESRGLKASKGLATESEVASRSSTAGSSRLLSKSVLGIQVWSTAGLLQGSSSIQSVCPSSVFGV